ncbi:MAG: penicillin acylase family protein [Pirellulaceae bacterium]|nr:penicillin acylase family protein [Pirellulaceae bacterium]
MARLNPWFPLIVVFIIEGLLGNAQAMSPLATEVTIHRDEWGVPHIHGKTNAAMTYGMGYAQAEDYFWQVEDNCIRAVGRYAEIVGESGLSNDVLNRSFEVVRRSKEDLKQFPPEMKANLVAYAAGINDYLSQHPEEKSRLIHRFEPWHVLAMDRHVLLSFVYGRSHVGRPKADTFAEAAHAAIGSNQWAIGPTKTANGQAMLLINPHQPWYGWGQYYEAHIYSDEGVNFSGAGFFGSPIPNKGHNGRLGWTYTVNEPDIADSYRVTFPDPKRPLQYAYGDGTRDAIAWTDTVRVRKTDGTFEERTLHLRKTHQGPLVRRENDSTWLAVRIAGLFDVRRPSQAFEMIRARNFAEWREAASICAIPMFNIAYADQAGNIFYVYNGSIPIRDPSFDWTQPVDGSDPRTEWQGIHRFDDLPQVFNPSTGYVQNCNSTPYTTTDDGNPQRGDFPDYMMEDDNHDTRRAKMSRYLLRQTDNLSFKRLQELAFDTTMYWPMTELPKFQRDLERLQKVDRQRAERVRPFLKHLLDWDCRSEDDSTATTLCVAWYMQLYGEGYPAETLKKEYRQNRLSRLDALVSAAEELKKIHGDWRVPWGDVHRIQRMTKRHDVVGAAAGFNRFLPSLPCSGAPGPLGIIYTVYSTPSIRFLRPRRYAVVGTSYVGAVTFGERVEAVTATQFGQSSDRKSPHFFDQAKLFSERKMKPAWFYPEDVKAHAVRSYQPGE